jgi:hypothetical protein
VAGAGVAAAGAAGVAGAGWADAGVPLSGTGVFFVDVWAVAVAEATSNAASRT